MEVYIVDTYLQVSIYTSATLHSAEATLHSAELCILGFGYLELGDQVDHLFGGERCSQQLVGRLSVAWQSTSGISVDILPSWRGSGAGDEPGQHLL